MANGISSSGWNGFCHLAERFAERDAGMAFVADNLGAWLIGLLADRGRRRLTTVVLGTDQERALRQAATVAVQLTASELSSGDAEQMAQLAMVVSQVFGEPVPAAPLAGQGTVLEALQAGIAARLAVLDDASLTGTGQSSADVLGVPGNVVADTLTGHLLREIVSRGSCGGPLEPLANQLSHDKAYLLAERVEGKVDRLDDKLLEVLARIDNTRAAAAAPVALAQLPPGATGFTGRDAELAVLAGLLDPDATGGPVVVSAVAGLAGVCGGLPLALQITAALLKADPALGVGELAGELSDEKDRLAALRYDDDGGQGGLSVAAAFELSCRRLDEASARVFRLLPVNPGPDVSTAAAAVLADLPVMGVRRVLAGLARAHLAEAAPGATGRWRMHDLLRLYAQRLSEEHADADGREQARDRLLGWDLDMAGAADGHLRALAGMAVPGQFTGRDAALAWLDAERASLVAAVQMAADTGRGQAALALPPRLAEYFSWRRRFDDWIATTTVSLDAARRLGDRRGEAAALTNLGVALAGVRRFEEAITAHQHAAAIDRDTGDRHGEGMALGNLGLALRQVRRFEEAITACQDAAAIDRETGDRHGEGMSLEGLGLALDEAGRSREAMTAYQDAIAIYRETGDQYREGITRENLDRARAAQQP
jgi:tetratricopeptide (TPR) repeat protein